MRPNLSIKAWKCPDSTSILFIPPLFSSRLQIILKYPPNIHRLLIVRMASDLDLCKNTMKYRNIHKHRDAAEIRLHFINNKWLKYAYRQNGNKIAQALVVYLWEEMCRLLASELYVTMRLERLYIIEKQWKTLNIQKPNPRRWNAETMDPVWVSWYINFPGA